MIVFDLCCAPLGHRFEGWFASSGDFASQQERGLLTCPQCGSGAVTKAPMAPAVSRKANQLPAAQPPAAVTEPVAAPPAAAMVGAKLPAEAVQLMQQLAVMQAEALKQSRWVGNDFAEQSRAIHYGERAVETIHGQATPDEARALLEEGIAVMPLPFPVVPPEQAN